MPKRRRSGWTSLFCIGAKARGKTGILKIVGYVEVVEKIGEIVGRGVIKELGSFSCLLCCVENMLSDF